MSAPERLREAIAARGLTIDAFAALLGEKPQRVKDVLRGKQRLPESMMASMAREGFDVRYVLTGTDEIERRLAAIGTATKISQLVTDRAEKRAVQQAAHEALVDALTGEEQQLVHYFRAASDHGRSVLLSTAAALAQAPPAAKADSTKPKGKAKR